MDLYRLSGASKDLLALDLDHVFSRCVSLIEWPSRLGDMIPSERLDIRITIPQQPVNDKEDEALLHQEDYPRSMWLQPQGHAWVERIRTLLSEGYIDDLLQEEA